MNIIAPFLYNSIPSVQNVSTWSWKHLHLWRGLILKLCKQLFQTTTVDVDTATSETSLPIWFATWSLGGWGASCCVLINHNYPAHSQHTLIPRKCLETEGASFRSLHWIRLITWYGDKQQYKHQASGTTWKVVCQLHDVHTGLPVFLMYLNMLLHKLINQYIQIIIIRHLLVYCIQTTPDDGQLSAETCSVIKNICN
jgi:hypothetical protein